MTTFSRSNNSTDFKCNYDFLLTIFFPKVMKVYLGISIEAEGWKLCPVVQS